LGGYKIRKLSKEVAMSELVFDIGMHNGDDTAYYLARGYRVVAIEANPDMCAMARKRFANEITSGQLSIRNVGIAETHGEMDFWVSSQTEWSSFHVENATKGGAEATSIKVGTMPFQQLIQEEGTPFFVKIDIEMNDSLCLKDLASSTSRPAYLSVEMSHAHAGADINLLDDLGYRSFKCIRQNDLREINPGNVVYQEEFRRGLNRLEWLPRREILLVVQRLRYRRRSVNGWKFKHGSSGPLGVELPGRWLSCDEMLSVWHHLAAYDLRLGAGGLGEWFDIHAVHDSARGKLLIRRQTFRL
jgi:FkbM family methyltransferase